MSTRSQIGYTKDNTFYSVYCHYDGYPLYMLRTLKNNFNKFDDVHDLVSKGSIQYIDQDGVVEYFDDKCIISESYSLSGVVNTAHQNGGEYVYIFDNSIAQWQCTKLEH